MKTSYQHKSQEIFFLLKFNKSNFYKLEKVCTYQFTHALVGNLEITWKETSLSSVFYLCNLCLLQTTKIGLKQRSTS